MNTTIIERTEQGDIAYDVFHKLAEGRLLFISEYIDDKVATEIVATFLYLDSENNKEKISLYINAEGGDIRSILMIYDIMNMVVSPIETICVGSAFNEVALLLAAGSKGKRYATKSSVICLSQLSYYSSIYSDMTDVKILAERTKSDNDRIMAALAKCTGKSAAKLKKDLTYKKFMMADQAAQYGVIDYVIESTK